MSKVQKRFLEKFAELSESFEKSDVENNPSDVLQSGMATAIVAMENEESGEKSELSKNEEIQQEQDRLKQKFGNSDDNQTNSWDSHSSLGGTKKNRPNDEQSSDNEELSENEQDEVSRLQAELAERIFSG